VCEIELTKSREVCDVVIVLVRLVGEKKCMPTKLISLIFECEEVVVPSLASVFWGYLLGTRNGSICFYKLSMSLA